MGTVGRREDSTRRATWIVAAVVAAVALVPLPASAAPGAGVAKGAPLPTGLDCDDWRYGPDDEPASLPAEYDRNDYKRTSLRDPRADLFNSPQNQCGQKGAAVDLAWGLSTGIPDVLIAVLDSGIRWRDAGAMADLATKAHINLGEAVPPCADSDGDCNGDDLFNISDFGAVTDRNGNGVADPEDLILDPAFSDGADDDSDGYIDNISGWDFLYGDNDPFDTVSYGHGTGEAMDSTAASNGTGDVGSCPQCMFLPIRVSDSFVADGGRFAAGVLFALDSGADVVQEALGALNNPRQAQQAIDAAYDRGVVVVASMADEASPHPNLPASLEHTMAVNSITEKSIDLLGPAPVDGYLALNGCTNFGGHTFVSIPSSSCSSEATGQSAGMVGLVESYARELEVEPHPSLGGLSGRSAGDVLTANEVMQLVRSTADDIDFATPNDVDPANNFGESSGSPLLDTVRYPTRPGWDEIHGYGRINAYELLHALEAESIPPEAMIDGPSWFDLLPVTGTVDVTGTVAAERAESYDYRVEWAPGAQGPEYPGTDTWTVIGGDEGLTAPVSGTLASLDLATVAAALPNDATGPPVDPDDDDRPDEERFSARLRVVVTAHGGSGDGLTGEMQKQIFVHDDPDLVDGYPARIDGVGAASPSFTDVDGDGTTELVVGTDDGTVHAWQSDGSELPGFPVRTDRSSWWPSDSPTADADGIEPHNGSLTIGGPTIGDLDRDGTYEIVATDGSGKVSVWSSTGDRRVTMAVNPDYSRDEAAAQDSRNRTKPGFLAAPALGDLDGDGDREIVAAALDRHVYTWHHDGELVDGFPVLVVDPAKVSSVDAVTHHVTFAEGSGVEEGGELIVTPTLADLTGDGRPEIILGAQEQYRETPNIGDGATAVALLAAAGDAGNSRVYAISPDGSDADSSPTSAVHPDAQAYLPGWPAKVAMASVGLLPTIGDGVAMAAVAHDVNPAPGTEVIVASSAGPLYVFGPNGDGVFGATAAGDIPLFWSAGLGLEDAGFFGGNRNSEDLIASTIGFGGPSVGDLDSDPAADIAAPTAGLTRLIDILAADRQLPGDDQLSAWDGRTRLPLYGSPRATSDLAFFVAPAIIDLDSDGKGESIAGNSTYTIDAYDGDGDPPEGWPKLTGGWSVGTPAVGDWDGDGTLEVAQPRRDGVLLVWNAPGSAGGDVESATWSQWGCDSHHSGACVDTSAGPSETDAFINAVYSLVLGRAADPGGLAYWRSQIESGLRSRPGFVRALLATTEGRNEVCDSLYESTLDRPADSGGLAWCRGLLADGEDATDVRARLFGSAEFYAQAGGTVDEFLLLLYERGLGRSPDTFGASHWRIEMEAGASRTDVAHGVLDSAEGQGRVVDGGYMEVLSRAADAGGRSYWIGRLHGGYSDLDFIAALLGSDEYYLNVTEPGP